MLKTVLIPQNNQVVLNIPDHLIGKQIEVLLYTKDELKESNNNKNINIQRFKGLLNKEEAEQYHTYLNLARTEWNRDI